MESNKSKKSIFDNPLFKTKVKSANVKMPEMLIGYLVGPFGALIASGIFTAFLNKYWTGVLFAGTTNTAVGTFLKLLPLLSAILIVIGNLVVGQLVEKTRTKAGKARPWILLSSILLGVSCILMFTVPLLAGSNDIVKMILTAVSYNLYYAIAFPMYNTANSALVPLSTRNAGQRSGLAAFVNFSHLGVMGVGSMIFPIIVSTFLKESVGAWAGAFIVVGAISFVCAVLQYYFTRERVSEETLNLPLETKGTPIGKQVGACVKEPFWWIILCFYLVFQFSGAIKNLSMTYFCNYVVDNSFWSSLGLSGGAGFTMTMLGIAGAVPMAIAMAFIWPLSRKFSKQIVVIVGALIGAVGGVIAGIWSSNPLLVTIGIALKCFGSAPGCYMILAMISDTLDHMEAKNGFRCDGFTMSVYSSLMVASTPVMTAVFNMLNPNATNFDTLFADMSNLSQEAVASQNMITISYVWIETIAYVVAAVILIFFLVEKDLKKDQETIKAKQKADAEAAGLVWEDPADRLKRMELEAEVEAEKARVEELKNLCTKKGLNFEEENKKYLDKAAAKKAAAEAKKAKKANKK